MCKDFSETPDDRQGTVNGVSVKCVCDGTKGG